MTEAEEVLDVWRAVLESGQFILGPQLEAFEREFGAYLGSQHVIGVSSGTDALTLALEVIGVEGREVLVPALSFIGTAEAVVHAGGIPVFCDVDPETWCLTPATAQPQMGPDVAAIVPVHLFGNPAPVDQLSNCGVPVLEDACQAAGARYKGKMVGTLGRAAAFSFYPSKVLAGCGDGGAVVTGDAKLAARVRRLRAHGSADNEHHTRIGYTARLDELQAAALRVRLRHLPGRLAAHQARGSGDQRVTDGGTSACHQTVRLGPGLGRSFYSLPLHLQPAMRPYYRGPLPNAERFARANHAEPPIQTASRPPQTEDLAGASHSGGAAGRQDHGAEATWTAA